MILLLDLEPVHEALAGGLASEVEAIQLIWGVVNSNFRGFRGIAALCCQVVGKKGICLQQGDVKGTLPVFSVVSFNCSSMKQRNR